MTEQTLPNLGPMSAEMAKNVSLATVYADTMAAAVDQLVMAANRDDWDELGAISQQLAHNGRQSGQRAVSAMAQIVCDESKKPGNALGTRRSLVRLIGACGR